MNSNAINFLDIYLPDNGVNTIEIPVIQRDYAQGRKDNDVSRIRERFLNVLHDALIEKSAPVKLDFIYGNITEGKLIPLDGQQRLTTLFLLHWYIAKHEKVNESEYSILNNFTYRTRFSSQHFCESLVRSMPDFSVEKISSWIIDQNWFMYSWDKDPTIDSMLTMLDSIHGLFKDTTNIWGKLMGGNVSFYFLPLEEMGLTDSLYIKMNSRGKPLTEFEHFKADFEKIIKEVSSELYREFIYKADIAWVDMLWKYRGDDDITDDEFMRYYRFVTEIICYQNDIEILTNDFDLAVEVYGIKNNDAEQNLKYLFKSFDCWKDLSSIDETFNNYFSKHSYEKNKVCLYSDDVNLFKQCCDYFGNMNNGRRQFTLNNTLLLYAVLEYLHNKETVNEDAFVERIRIIRNLVLNSSDEIRESRFKALLSDVRSIVTVKTITLNTLGFNEIQKQEEIDKIQWRVDNPQLIEIINKLEDHNLLLGSISIIELANTDKFPLRAARFEMLFSGSINYLLISKALLAINDYSQLASWRFLFGNENNSTWRELFTQSKKRKNFANTKDILHTLLDKMPDQDIKAFLNNQIKEYLASTETQKDWRYYFIKYPSMRMGNSGVYYWQNDPSRVKANQYDVIMMNTALSLNGKHWNPFLYTVYMDDQFKEIFNIDDYNAPLIDKQTLNKIFCTNGFWEIKDANDQLIQNIEIIQQDGCDQKDRIEIFRTEYLKKCTKMGE
jgi:hypothetical protein